MLWWWSSNVEFNTLEGSIPTELGQMSFPFL
jgi:hypothetical protein